MSLIVVVDDRQTNRNIMKRLAKSVEPEAEVQAYSDPREALEWMVDKDVDLLITDYKMPAMNGAEFVKECRRRLKCFDLPIVVITAYEDRDFRYRSLEAGATDFLLSPIDHHEFRARALNLLTMWRQKQIIKERAYSLERELKEANDQHAEALRKSEQKLRNVINTIPALVSATDNEDHCVFLNNYHEQIFDIEWQGAVGKSKSDLFGSQYGERQRRLDQRVFATGQILRGYEEKLVDRDGESRLFLTTKAPLHDGSGGVELVVTVSLDITDRDRAENDARRLESELAHVSRLSSMGEMAAGFAHELNQPLTAISNYAQGSLRRLRSERVTPPELQRVMELIADQAQRAGDIIRRIRRFVQKEDTQKQGIDLNSAIRETAALLSGEALRHEVDVALELADDLPDVMGDTIQVQQVILNLARNSFEAMSEAGSEARRLIIRTARRDAQNIEVMVADTGPGIPEEVSEHIFLPFFTTKSGGMGMGLSICRSIIEAHGGKLAVASNGSSGTAARFTLPIAWDIADGARVAPG